MESDPLLMGDYKTGTTWVRASHCPQEGFFIAALQSTSVLLEKTISTLILLKLELFIHIIQDA